MPFSTAVYQPALTQYIPTGSENDLFQYMLKLINQDRADQHLPPVTLDYNAGAQKHARDMLLNNYLAHWDTDGLKPYMRYTQAGGLNFEQENAAFSRTASQLDPKTELKKLEDTMVNNDAAENWSHRDNICNALNKKVSLGLAYDDHRLAMVQQFQGDYVEFYQPPMIKGNRLSLAGCFNQPELRLNNVTLTWDPLPQPMTAPQLTSGTYLTYSYGDHIGLIFPPAPENAGYLDLPKGALEAEKGMCKDNLFWLDADIGPLLQANGPGVYTICLVATLNGQTRNFTNYSIIVK